MVLNVVEPVDFGGGGDVSFFRQGCAGIIFLTRPSRLNSLTLDMACAIARAFYAWEREEDIAFILIEGEGRAFCAGGDVVSVWQSQRSGQDMRPFFAVEYCLNSLIGHFSKPCISFLNGFVMGGGAGLAMHGSHRIATENTLFAMPEAAIGFFPDVGMGSLLTKMKGNFGLYLALTGAKIKWGDCLQLGLSTHAIPVQDYLSLRQTLIETGNVHLLDKASQHLDFDTDSRRCAMIETCFGARSVEKIIDKLKRFTLSGSRDGDKNYYETQELAQEAQKDDAFATDTLNLLQTHSPTSLKVIYRHMEMARHISLDECLKLDYRTACHMLKEHDFYEGVRARLIDKDFSPNWRPEKLEFVNNSHIESYFMPCDNELPL